MLPAFEANIIAPFKKTLVALILDQSTNKTVLVAPAQDLNAERLNQALDLSGGIIYVAISPSRADAFSLETMQRPQQKHHSLSETWDVCVSVESRHGVSTGISVKDRARTIATLGQSQPNARMLVKPGHILPLKVKDGGVLVKQALPEGALDLVKISGFADASLLIECLDKSGEYLGASAAQELAEKWKIPFTTLDDLTRYRLESEKLIFRVAEAKLPTRSAGEMRGILYQSSLHGGEHLALIKGEITSEDPILTRVQPEFTFGDVFGGSNPPTRKQLLGSLEAIAQRGRGVLVYLRRPVAGQLCEQVNSWSSKFQEKPASMMREYGVGAQILRDLGIKKVELLTNSKKNLAGLTTFGIEIIKQRALSKIELSKEI